MHNEMKQRNVVRVSSRTKFEERLSAQSGHGSALSNLTPPEIIYNCIACSPSMVFYLVISLVCICLEGKRGGEASPHH